MYNIEKRRFEKKNLSNCKTIHCFFLWMIALKTHQDLDGKFTWIGNMTYNDIKWGLANTLLKSSLFEKRLGIKFDHK